MVAYFNVELHICNTLQTLCSYLFNVNVELTIHNSLKIRSPNIWSLAAEEAQVQTHAQTNRDTFKHTKHKKEKKAQVPCVNTYIYIERDIYIYIERERCIDIHAYIYTYTHEKRNLTRRRSPSAKTISTNMERNKNDDNNLTINKQRTRSPSACRRGMWPSCSCRSTARPARTPSLGA